MTTSDGPAGGIATQIPQHELVTSPPRSGLSRRWRSRAPVALTEAAALYDHPTTTMLLLTVWAFVGVVLEVGENDRFRSAIESMVLVVGIAAIGRWARRRRAADRGAVVV